MLLKEKSLSLPRNLNLKTSEELLKGKFTTPSLLNDSEVLSSASDKAKLFAKNFSKNSDLDDFYLFTCYPFQN